MLDKINDEKLEENSIKKTFDTNPDTLNQEETDKMFNNKSNKKRPTGFLPAIILSVILIVAIIGAGILSYFYALNNCKEATNNVALTYEIIDDNSEDLDKKLEYLKIGNIPERGYKVYQKDNDYYLLINFGQTFECCFIFTVNEVKVDGNNLKIKVGYNMCNCLPQYLRYPKVLIKLNKKPGNIDISDGLDIYDYKELKQGKSKKNNETLTYKVVEDYSTEDEDDMDWLLFSFESKGYKIIPWNYSYYLVIDHGETLSCCGKLIVQDVQAKGSELEVKVNYIDMCDCVANNKTYPKVVIKLNAIPTSIKINNGEYKSFFY